MRIFQAVILGIVQGLTEFLPISSSGHLIIFSKIFVWQDQGLTFDIFLHLGTLGAVLFYFRFEWLKLIKGLIFFKDKALFQERKLVFLIILGILPALVFGFVLELFPKNYFRQASFVAINLIFWGLILGAADRFYQKRKELVKEENPLTPKKAFLIGSLQSLALIPGGSRSGLSITGGLFAGLSRKAAVKFSFLMSAPLILGASIFEAIKIFSQTTPLNFNSGDLFFGFLSAFIAGFLALKFLVLLSEKFNFLPFVIYRLILGALILIFLL